MNLPEFSQKDIELDLSNKGRTNITKSASLLRDLFSSSYELNGMNTDRAALLSRHDSSVDQTLDGEYRSDFNQLISILDTLNE